jgi:hypothetical protein
MVTLFFCRHATNSTVAGTADAKVTSDMKTKSTRPKRKKIQYLVGKGGQRIGLVLGE